MRATAELTAEQEAEAQELATLVREAIADDVLAAARLLVSKQGTHPFGSTESQLRDVFHKAAGKALEMSLGQKKTGITGPP